MKTFVLLLVLPLALSLSCGCKESPSPKPQGGVTEVHGNVEAAIKYVEKQDGVFSAHKAGNRIAIVCGFDFLGEGLETLKKDVSERFGVSVDAEAVK